MGLWVAACIGEERLEGDLVQPVADRHGRHLGSRSVSRQTDLLPLGSTYPLLTFD